VEVESLQDTSHADDLFGRLLYGLNGLAQQSLSSVLPELEVGERLMTCAAPPFLFSSGLSRNLYPQKGHLNTRRVMSSSHSKRQ
jgi:hypothetical protein